MTKKSEKPPFIYFWNKKMYVPCGKYVMMVADVGNYKWEEDKDFVNLKMDGKNARIMLTQWEEVAKDRIKFHPLPEVLTLEEAEQLALDIISSSGWKVSSKTDED